MSGPLRYIINEPLCAVEYAVQTIDVPSLAESYEQQEHYGVKFSAGLQRRGRGHVTQADGHAARQAALRPADGHAARRTEAGMSLHLLRR